MGGELSPFKSEDDHPRPATDSDEDVVISYGINVHKDSCPNEIKEKVDRYPDLWSDTGRMIDVPEDLWMQVKLKDNWETTGAKLNHRPYVVSVNERTIIDETLDKMHNQDMLPFVRDHRDVELK